MFRAIPPGVIAPAAFKPPILGLTFVAGFSLGRTTGLSQGGATVAWDDILWQTGFTPELSGTITTVTIPAGVSFGVFNFQTGNSSVGATFNGNQIRVDGLIQAQNDHHAGDYNGGWATGIVEVTPGQTVEAYWNPNATTTIGAPQSSFSGRLYA